MPRMYNGGRGGLEWQEIGLRDMNGKHVRDTDTQLKINKTVHSNKNTIYLRKVCG